MRTRWLVSWIGGTDHDAAEGRLDGDVGPIAAAMLSDRGFDRVYLLTNYAHERSLAYCDWLAQRTAFEPNRIDLFDIDLQSPVEYDAIYKEVADNLASARLPRDDVELTFHLSPGTPAMAVIWIVLARTRFPARLIQTTRDKGLQEVNFFTDVADAFLPEYLRRTESRIEKLASGPKVLPPEFAGILHKSEAVARQVELARKVAAYDVPVLLLGETGTGKELFAEAIHATSRRKGKPYVAVNCGAIAPDLANSELFGHKKGAFTGADRDRRGHFQDAPEGTLLLFWMKLATYLWEPGCAYSGHYRLMRSCPSEAPNPLRSMCASSLQRIATLWPRSQQDAFERICSIVWLLAFCVCRHCATGTATSNF